MEIIKNNKAGFGIVLVILILVFIRSFSMNHFRNDAKKWAEPSVKLSNRITIEKAGSLKGKILIINLDKDVNPSLSTITDAKNIPPDSILSKYYFTKIAKHDGPVLLFSSESGISARIWMMLSQMGCKNIYILTNKADNEVFKYKFRSDTLLN
jgi:hypothetical protein